ncbi:hypothetical protein TIFTF001_004507 [Ficus carica]|uniref:Uncharacterized protein n=1 Tax=Ficus carica TaxID=3494 RepID=A0AA87ZYF9_FICCA|nr:hypothetical protein TIFTF001_004507 [Ficus carica]
MRARGKRIGIVGKSEAGMSCNVERSREGSERPQDCFLGGVEIRLATQMIVGSGAQLSRVGEVLLQLNFDNPVSPDNVDCFISKDFFL